MRGVSVATALVLVAGLAGCRTALRNPFAVRASDVDGDGRLDRFERLGAGGEVAQVVQAPEPGSHPERTLVLAIDGVPYPVFAHLQEEGYFRALHPASRLVVPFPSLTDVGFTTILRTAPAASYEDLAYERASGRTRGGLWDRIRNRYRELGPFHQVWDEEAPSLWGGFVYFAPHRVAAAELRRVEKALAERDHDPELVLYLGATDAFAHKLGWDALAEHLKRVDGVLRRWLARGGGERRVVLFSDHGMNRDAARRYPLARALERGGFRLAKRLGRAHEVVAPAYGLVGSIQIYTACGQERAVAAAAVALEGADFAVWRQDGRVQVVSRRGDDPRDRPEADYPDLRGRLERALPGAAVANPASVLVSLEDGWYYGSHLLDTFADIAGTHGNARSEASVGFLASNLEPTPSTLGAHEAWPYLGLARDPAAMTAITDPCAAPPATGAPEAAR